MSEIPVLKKPLFIVKPGSMSQRDIRRAEKFAGVIIVECKEPEQARYSEAPLDFNLDAQACAALHLMRVISRSEASSFYKSDLTKWMLSALLDNTGPAAVPIVKAVKK